MTTIVEHPARSGWLIVTPEIEELLDATHRIGLDDGSFVHPLHFREPDFLPGELEKIRIWAIAEVNRQAEAQQEATINLRGLYQQTEYLRWLIAGQPAQVSAIEYPLSGGDLATLVRFGDESKTDSAWLSETVATEKSTTSLLEQAKNEAEVRSILSGLVWPSVR